LVQMLEALVDEGRMWGVLVDEATRRAARRSNHRPSSVRGPLKSVQCER
jgi:hypothetical protein